MPAGRNGRTPRLPQLRGAGTQAGHEQFCRPGKYEEWRRRAGFRQRRRRRLRRLQCRKLRHLRSLVKSKSKEPVFASRRASYHAPRERFTERFKESAGFFRETKNVGLFSNAHVFCFSSRRFATFTCGLNLSRQDPPAGCRIYSPKYTGNPRRRCPPCCCYPAPV